MSISYIEQVDYFTLFGLCPIFSQESSKIKASYLSLQRNIHPDNFIDATKQEKLLATQYAAKVNAAYRTLCDPLTRAIYLLQLHGVEAIDETDTSMPMDFLMEQMTLREALSEPMEPNALIGIKQSVVEALTDCQKKLGEYLDNPPLNLIDAKMCVRKMQFYSHIQYPEGV